MAMETNLFEQEGRSASEDDSLKQNLNPVSPPTGDLDKDTSGFDCNICFDSAQDPVVTLCGHLYCWPCIYKWLHIRTSSVDPDQQQRTCPVCKANISSSSLVPLYGRGSTSSDSRSKDPHSDLVIPQRPPPSGSNPVTTSLNPDQRLHENLFHSHSQSFHHQQYFPHTYGGYETLASSSLGGIAMTNFFNPMFGMLGEMAYARISGSSNTSMFTYPYQSSYPFFGNNNLRMRRQEMQVDKSLSRVSIFLFCCIILCLLLF